MAATEKIKSISRYLKREIKEVKNVKLRMIASNEVYIDGSCIGRYVVKLYGNLVVGYEPLMCEQPFTEWICEPIKIYSDSTGSLRVNLCEY